MRSQSAGSLSELVVSLDGMSDTPNILTVEKVPAAAIVPQDLNPEMPTSITEAEAEHAATELGLRFFQPRKAALLKKIGLFQIQQGVVHLGVGRLAVADESLETLIDTAVEIATDKGEMSEVRVSALMAGKHLVESLQKSIQMVVDFQQDNLLTTERKKRVFFSDQPIVPIQAQNVNVNVIDSSKQTPQS